MPLWVAIQFLTRFPVATTTVPDARQLGASVCFYPLVGLLLGLLLLGVGVTLAGAGAGLVAFVLLGLLTLITGALHLDGLADTADAWVGGHGSRERTLQIMKDPACGPAGVSALVLVLLGKYAALTVLIQDQAWFALLLAPTLGRSGLLALMMFTPYVRRDGLGAEMVLALPRPWGAVALVLVAAMTLALAQTAGLVLLAVVVALIWMLRSAFSRRLGGITGDTLGAACELIEMLALLTLAVLQVG